MNTITTRCTLVSSLVLAALSGACQQQSDGPRYAQQTVMQTGGSGLDRLKALAGTWQGQAGEMGAATVTYRVVSNGSAVEEDLFPGTSHEMITMFHEDGGRLMATHYCALQNQPRLVGGMTGPNTVELGMTDITNYRADPGNYMGRAKYTFDGPDHITSHWTGYDRKGGVWHEASFDLRRVK